MELVLLNEIHHAGPGTCWRRLPNPRMQSDLRHVRFQGAPVLRAMPPRAGRYVRATPGPTPSSDAIDDLSRFVLAGAGLDAGRYRAAPLRRRVPACLRALRATSEAEARSTMLHRPEAIGTALETLLIGVSSFFRDPPVFETLRTRIVPGLAARPGSLRVLSVGCSSGAEIYSVAMLLAEAGLLGRAHLTGVDCRAEAVSRARAAVFDEQSLESLDEDRRARFFERVPAGWRTAAAVRQRCDWVVADATMHIPAGPWDIVLCCNVAIYLESWAAASLFTCLARALAPGGVLILGKAERPPAAVTLDPVERCVYRKP